MYENEVQKGAFWLDVKFPGWVDKIDLSRLNMRYADCCILGQVTGNYWSDEYRDVRNSKFGFDIEGVASTDIPYEALAYAWERLINDRRKSAAVNSLADREAVEVSQDALDKALDVIRSIHDNTDTYVPELTPQGALATLLMDLGIRIKVV